MSDPLIQFLRARLDEDEQRAQDGYYSDTYWEMWTAGAHLAAWYVWRQRFPREQWDAATNDAVADATRDALRERVTAHEADRSARMLAEVEAKRKILTEYEEADARAKYPDFDGGVFSGLELVVQHLAVPYSDHPDYREEWKP